MVYYFFGVYLQLRPQNCKRICFIRLFHLISMTRLVFIIIRLIGIKISVDISNYLSIIFNLIDTYRFRIDISFFPSSYPKFTIRESTSYWIHKIFADRAANIALILRHIKNTERLLADNLSIVSFAAFIFAHAFEI
jgi:hypothetical protein